MFLDLFFMPILFYSLQVDKYVLVISQSEPEFRPLMSEVVQDLQSMLQRGSPSKNPITE